MSIVTVTKKWIANRCEAPSPETNRTQAQIDAELIRDEKIVGAFEAKVADVLRRLEAEPARSPRYKALQAEHRQIYRDAGYREDLYFNGGIWTTQKPE